MTLEELGGGVWRWELPHPEWRPGTERVGCYAVRSGADTVLIDPLFEPGIAEALDAIVTGTVTIAVTIPYHVRSAAEASRRWDARIVGHGAPVLRDGRAALAEALDADAWTGD